MKSNANSEFRLTIDEYPGLNETFKRFEVHEIPDIAFLPSNLEEARSTSEFTYPFDTIALIKLLLERDIEAKELMESDSARSYFDNRSIELILPVLSISAAALSENPDILSTTLAVIKDFVNYGLTRVELGRKVKLDVVVEEDGDRKYRKISYEGPSRDLDKICDLINLESDHNGRK